MFVFNSDCELSIYVFVWSVVRRIYLALVVDYAFYLSNIIGKFDK